MQNTVQTPFTYRSPFTFTGQAHGEVWNQQIGEPFPYRYPVINQPHRQPVAVPATTQSPSITYNNIGDARYPYRAPARQPVIYQHIRQVSYDHRSPFTYPRTNVNAQQPNIRSAQQPYPYIASAQENNERSSQTPFTYQARQPSSAQQSYPYIANAQQPTIEVNKVHLHIHIQ